MQPMLAETIASGSIAAEVAELAVAQRHRQLGMEHRVRSRRAAAEVGFVHRHLDGEAERAQVRLDAAAQLLAMLQRAGRMERQRPSACGRQGLHRPAGDRAAPPPRSPAERGRASGP